MAEENQNQNQGQQNDQQGQSQGQGQQQQQQQGNQGQDGGQKEVKFTQDDLNKFAAKVRAEEKAKAEKELKRKGKRA